MLKKSNRNRRKKNRKTGTLDVKGERHEKEKQLKVKEKNHEKNKKEKKKETEERRRKKNTKNERKYIQKGEERQCDHRTKGSMRRSR